MSGMSLGKSIREEIYMMVVNVFTDGDRHVETILVHHNVESKTFKESWDDALEFAQGTKKEGWGIEDVYSYLDRMGWQVIRLDDVCEVRY